MSRDCVCLSLLAWQVGPSTIEISAAGETHSKLKCVQYSNICQTKLQICQHWNASRHLQQRTRSYAPAVANNPLHVDAAVVSSRSVTFYLSEISVNVLHRRKPLRICNHNFWEWRNFWNEGRDTLGVSKRHPACPSEIEPT